MSPEQHDERLLELEAAQRLAERSAQTAERIYRLSLGHRRRGGIWVAEGEGPELPVTDTPECERWLAALGEVQRVRALVAEHERDYLGWARYRLVISSDGHVHADSQCRSFRETTKTVVVPALSGRPSEAAVEMLGNACCSVCMPAHSGEITKVPSSLVNVLVRQGTQAFERALARRNELAQRKNQKALRTLDGD